MAFIGFHVLFVLIWKPFECRRITHRNHWQPFSPLFFLFSTFAYTIRQCTWVTKLCEFNIPWGMLAMSNTEDPSNWVIDWAVHARNHFSHPSEQPVYPGNLSQSLGDSQGPLLPSTGSNVSDPIYSLSGLSSQCFNKHWSIAKDESPNWLKRDLHFSFSFVFGCFQQLSLLVYWYMKRETRKKVTMGENMEFSAINSILVGIFYIFSFCFHLFLLTKH